MTLINSLKHRLDMVALIESKSFNESYEHFILDNNKLKISFRIIRRYILSLLNKFEVALTWDLRTLLIPSLLPLTEDEPENTITLKVASKSPKRKMSMSESNCLVHKNNRSAELFGKTFKPLSRLLLISYFPSGFWSRLMIRILADNQIGDIARSVYNINDDVRLK